MGRRIVAVTSVWLVAGCSLVTSLDGYAGGGGTTVGAEGGTSSDGGGDAAPDVHAADGDAGHFCAGVTGTCVDYDDGSVGSWDGTDIDPGASAVVDQGSLLVTIPPAANAACFTKNIPAGATSMDVEADIRVEALGSYDFDLFRFSGSPNHDLSLQVNAVAGGRVQFDQDVPPVDGGGDEQLTDTSFTFDAGWHHIRWTHRLGAGANVELFVDGTSRGTFVASPLDYEAPTVLDVGDCGVQTTSPWKVRYDNVQIAVK